VDSGQKDANDNFMKMFVGYSVQTPPPLIRHARACHLLPRSGRRLKVSAHHLFVQRIIFITIIQLVKEEYLYLNHFAILIELLQTFSIKYSYLTNKRLYLK